MISVIIVDYNSIENTLEYIRIVNRSIINCPALHFIVIENGDCKETEKIKQISLKYEEKTISGCQVDICLIDDIKIVYCFSNNNLGYAKGNNLGTVISDMLFQDDYYIFSNNDIAFKTDLDWNGIFEIYKNDPQICVVGPRIIGRDGVHQSPNRRVNPVRTLLIDYLVFKPFRRQSDLDYSGESKKCFRVCGCFMVVKADLFRKIGRFDDGTFLFCEEMILSERLDTRGYKVYFCNDFELIHNHGDTIETNASFQKIEKWQHESYIYYFGKYRNTPKMILVLSKVCFRIFLLRKSLTKQVKKLIRNGIKW